MKTNVSFVLVTVSDDFMFCSYIAKNKFNFVFLYLTHYSCLRYETILLDVSFIASYRSARCLDPSHLLLHQKQFLTIKRDTSRTSAI